MCYFMLTAFMAFIAFMAFMGLAPRARGFFSAALMAFMLFMAFIAGMVYFRRRWSLEKKVVAGL